MPTHRARIFSTAPTGPAPTANFHARVAGVGLLTAVVVLVAACLTFMLQQWAVARTHSHRIHEGLAEIAAHSVAPAMRTGDRQHINITLSSLTASEDVVGASIRDPQGRVISQFEGSAPPTGALDRISKPIVVDGRPAGEMLLVVRQPTLAPMLPQFIALTLVLLFGGVGVALFLARSLARRVIAPVQRLSEAMNEVAAGGSFTPVEGAVSDELFRSLTDSFNHLLAKLGEREEDLKAAMRELEEARDAANAANVLKTHFLANMSHEIRTPLNGVLAMADVMSLGEMAPVQRERLEVIRRSGGLLLAVLNDVLDLSKIEAGKLTLLDEDFELEAVAAQTKETFAIMAQGKGLSFDVEVSEAACGWWRGDADRLRQICGNLLSNAVKFTSRGTVKALMDLSPAGALRLTVSDTGVGISAEKLPTLFEKFTQADNSATRRFGGTGLGLAICRELTHMMGGVIEVYSREGQGSTFTVELPLPRGAPTVADGIPTGGAEEGSLRVLAAEDNPTNQQVLVAVLGSLGIEVEIVPDGREAVEAWRSGAHDLVLMDIQMPVMDGIAATRRIRELERMERRRRTPVVALTANALTHQVDEYLAAGMDAHVAKPIEIAKLYEAISTALNHAAANSTTGRAPRASSAA